MSYNPLRVSNGFFVERYYPSLHLSLLLNTSFNTGGYVMFYQSDTKAEKIVDVCALVIGVSFLGLLYLFVFVLGGLLL